MTFCLFNLIWEKLVLIQKHVSTLPRRKFSKLISSEPAHCKPKIKPTRRTLPVEFRSIQAETLVEVGLGDRHLISLVPDSCKPLRGLQGSLGPSQGSTGNHYSRESETLPWVNPGLQKAWFPGSVVLDHGRAAFTKLYLLVISPVYTKRDYEKTNRLTKLILFIIRILLRILFTTLNNVLLWRSIGEISPRFLV